MIETPLRISGEPIEEQLRAQVARSDALSGAVEPVLRHLLDNDNRTAFGDEILALVRGMQLHLAQRLLTASDDGHPPERSSVAELADALLDCPGVLRHLHALALEWRLLVRLEQQHAVDPVVPPLLQALIASPEAETQDTAMKFLAAQARWCQGMRRMQLSPRDLPGKILDAVVGALRSVTGFAEDLGVPQLREDHDESATRLGLAARLVANMGSAASVALDLRHGGATLFASALSSITRQGREQVILSMQDTRGLRLALGLRAAALPAPVIDQQLLILHGDTQLPSGFDRLGIEPAAAILAEARDGHR